MWIEFQVESQQSKLKSSHLFLGNMHQHDKAIQNNGRFFNLAQPTFGYDV